MNKVFKEGYSFSHQSLAQDFELVSRALDASIAGIVITDNQQPDNPIIYCNTAFEEMSGYSRQEIIGHNCRFLQKEDRSQKEREAIKKAVREGTDCLIEIRNYRKDGTLFWNELSISPIKDGQGNVTHFIGVQNDVSRRKKAELDVLQQQQQMEKRIEERTRTIEENKQYLASIVATVRESLIVLDESQKVLSVNDHFLKTFKVSLNETEGILLYELGNGQWNIPKLKQMLEEVLPTQNPVDGFEVEHDFPHIGKKLMLLNAHQIELEGSYKNRILIAIEDITDRREIERRKDDFLSVASHELKTPLTTVKGYVQMMNRHVPENTSDKFRDILAKTELHIERLNNLLTELLDVSRIQSGNIKLHKETFDFDKMVLETVEGLQTATRTHRIRIEGTAINEYQGDESHIVQVITNLLSNAIKYSPDSPEILVHLSLVNEYLKVSVTDHGLGISQQDQPKVFDRFFRAGDIQQRLPGMGIGLYVCDQIVKNHGGNLWVESEKGKGSTFSFTLPLKESGALDD